MDNLGINAGFLVVQIVNLAILAGWIALGIYSAVILRKSALSTEMKILWIITIVALPLIGAVAFLYLHSRDTTPAA